VHAHLTVVLPSALEGDVPFAVFTGDPVVTAAPAMPVHGVDIAAPGIGPSGGPFPGKGIGGKALIGCGGGVGIVGGVTRHPLAPAVDEQLVQRQVRRGCGLEDPGSGFRRRLPVQVQPEAAAQYRLALVARPVDHRGLPGPGVRGGEHKGVGEVVDAILQNNLHRTLSRMAAGKGLRGLKRQPAVRRVNREDQRFRVFDRINRIYWIHWFGERKGFYKRKQRNGYLRRRIQKIHPSATPSSARVEGSGMAVWVMLKLWMSKSSPWFRVASPW